MTRTINKSYFWFDVIVIILQISRGLTIVGAWVSDLFPIPYGIEWLILMIAAHALRFGFKFGTNNKHGLGIFKLFFAIQILDILQALFLGNASGFVRIITVIYLFIFFQYLLCMYEDYSNQGSYIIKPYVYLSVYNIVVVILCAFLILSGVLSETDNLMSVNSLTYDNVVNSSGVYYFPGHLSLCTTNSRVLMDFGVPMLTGLTHEPHVLCMLILPSLFLLYRKKYSTIFKIGILVSYLIIMVISTSTTSFVCMAIVLVLEELWSVFIGKNSIIQAVLIIGIIVFIAIRGHFVTNLILEMVTERTTAGSASSGSMDYSAAMLEYVVTPTNIFGHGNMPGGVGQQVLNNQIGLVTCLMDLGLYVWFLVIIVRNVLSKNPTKHYVGMAILYFALHLLKLSYAILTYPYFIFMLFVLWIFDRTPEENIE